MFGSEGALYHADRTTIESEARRLEAERGANDSRDPLVRYHTEALLRIAIVMAYISILSLPRLAFSATVGMAMFSGVSSLNGYPLLFSIPFVH